MLCGSEKIFINLLSLWRWFEILGSLTMEDSNPKCLKEIIKLNRHLNKNSSGDGFLGITMHVKILFPKTFDHV